MWLKTSYSTQNRPLCTACGDTQSDRFGEYINKLFERYGLKIFGKTPMLKDRDAEISEWIKIHPDQVENYVILDDFDFEWSENNAKCLIKTMDAIGLDEIAVGRGIKILNGQ